MSSTTKSPAENFDYALDFAADLAQSETISAIVSVTSTNDATAADSTSSIVDSAGGHAPAISGSKVIFWLKGGNLGEKHTVSVKVTTSGGREYEGLVHVEVVKGV